jgi:hypothetical protein
MVRHSCHPLIFSGYILRWPVPARDFGFRGHNTRTLLMFQDDVRIGFFHQDIESLW